MSEISTPLNWVKARSLCCLENVFKELEHGVRADIQDAQSLVVPAGAHTKYSIAQISNQRFSAVRSHYPQLHSVRSVDFELGDGEIVVSSMGNGGKKELLAVGLTLNGQGQCKLKIKGQDGELEQWQVRRIALEGLFFS